MGDGAVYTVSLSEPLWWEKIGKVANRAKLAVPSHSDPLLWEQIRKVANRAKLAVPSHSEPPWWEKIRKVANKVKLAVPSHSEPLWWEKLQIGQNWPFQDILSHFSWKRLESCESGKIGRSESF